MLQLYSVLLPIGTLILSLIKLLIIFYLGKILSHPEQLRNFLGANSNIDVAKEVDYSKISFWLKKIGQILIIIAILSAIATIIGIIFTTWRLQFF